jgi:beta-glucanase (GH16 family)
MKRLVCRAGALAASLLCAATLSVVPAEASTASAPRCFGARGAVKFFDNFSGASSLRPWEVQMGYTRGDLNELQRYTGRGLSVAGGELAITAFRKGSGYRSGRVSTQSSCKLLYGSIQARIQTPPGQGLWSAFWLEDQGDKHEIDVMEALGERPSLYYAGVHMAGVSDMHSGSGPIAGSWHVYGVLWTPHRVTFTLDGHPFCTRDDVINTPLFIVLNLAVGGWGGPPDATTHFPSAMNVDWVRAYKLGHQPPLRRPTAEQCQLLYS